MQIEPATLSVAASPAKVRLTMLGLLLGLFLAGLDQTIVATALPDIARTIGDWESMGWVVMAYLIASTATTPIYGRLSDLYGRRPIVLFSVGTFVASSILCALSRTLQELVASRILQGIGGGGLRVMALVVIADLVPPRDRGRYQGYFSGTMTTANALGPVLGGVLAQGLAWPWIFWINVPIGLAAAALSARNLERASPERVRAMIDWPGIALILLAVTLVLLALGDGSRGAAAPNRIALAGLSLLAVGALIERERCAPRPVLPLPLLRNAVFCRGAAIVSLMSAFVVGLIVVVPIFYHFAAGLMPQAIALRMVPLTCGVALGSFMAGRLVSRSGRYSLYPAVGAVAAGLACLALAVTGLGSSLPYDLSMMGVIGMASGFQLSPISVAVQNALPRGDIGVGMGSLLLFRSLAAAIGVALFSGIMVHALGEAAPSGGLSALVSAPSLDPVQRDTIRWSVARIFLGGATMMALSLWLALTLPERALQGHSSSD